ncbi:hypothetical protein ACYSNM_12515, partial [Myroides sp. LJL116]
TGENAVVEWTDAPVTGIATETTPGVVKPGEGLSVDEHGSLDVSYPAVKDELAKGKVTSTSITVVSKEENTTFADVSLEIKPSEKEGQILTTTGTGENAVVEWKDAPKGFELTLDGDVTLDEDGKTVVGGIQNVPVSETKPSTDGQTLVYETDKDGNGQWVPGRPDVNVENILNAKNLTTDGKISIATDATSMKGDSEMLKRGAVLVDTHLSIAEGSISTDEITDGTIKPEDIAGGEELKDKVLSTDKDGNPEWMDKSTLVAEPWFVQKTDAAKDEEGKGATLNTQAIYQTGAVAIKKETGIAGADLDVAGAIRGAGAEDAFVGENSVAFGTNSFAMALNSFAVGGTFSEPDKDGKEVEYSGAMATAENAIALGSQAMALGENSSVLGFYSGAYGKKSVAIGTLATANGTAAIAIGSGATVEGDHSIGIGYNIIAKTAIQSIGIGDDNHVNATMAFAFGNNIRVNSFESMAMGYGTVSTAQRETVMGSYNAIRDGQALLETNDGKEYENPNAIHFQIGNGIGGQNDDDTNGNTSTAFAMLKNGNTGIGIVGLTDGKAKPTATLDVGAGKPNGSTNDVLNGNIGDVRFRALPTFQGEVTDKVVVTNEEGRLRTVKATMPKVFYMPAVTFDTSNPNKEVSLKMDLHAEYIKQFGGTSGSFVSSETDVAPEKDIIPTFKASELKYYVTYYDKSVFEIISISKAGEMEYKIIGHGTAASYINIVFVVRD